MKGEKALGISRAFSLGIIAFSFLVSCSSGGNSSSVDSGSRGSEPGVPVASSKGEYGPLQFAHRDCTSIVAAFNDENANQLQALCDQVLGPDSPLNEHHFSHKACLDQAASFGDQGVAFCDMVFPALGYSSDSPVEGPNHYLTMPDGASIAINIRMPDSYQPGSRYPVVIEMSGYESGSSDGATAAGDVAKVTGAPLPLQGGTRAAHGKYYHDDYVSIVASVRGTGCSSGEFDLFSEISAWDGYHLIEWAAKQPWANGAVGLFGHSYSGITATLIAATQPPSLKVLSTSGLVGDLYRDIVYPGGVTNYGFPLLWTGGVRVAFDVAGGTLAGLLADNGDRQCLRNQAGRNRTVLQDPLINGLQDWDGAWYQARSVVYKADQINVPTHIVHAYQDEQVGPRGNINVFDNLSADIDSRLVMTNGIHDTQAQREETIAERKAWLDYYLLGRPNPFINPATQAKSVRVLLEMQNTEKGILSNGEINSSNFPLPETRWTNFYFQPDGSLSTDISPENGGSSSYVHGSHRQAYSFQLGVNNGSELTAPDGPDELKFQTEPFAEPVVIAGPVTATLYHKASPAEAPAFLPLPLDVELQVQLLDIAPDGSSTYIQRGALRASGREIDEARSQKTNEGRIYRPYRPHGPLSPTNLPLANTTYEYLVEIFPVGHVFRPGHRLVVKVHAPALDDNDWIYIPKSAPTMASVSHSNLLPSHVMMPVIPLAAVENHDGYPARDGCIEADVRCVGGSGGAAPGVPGIGGSPF